MNMTDDVDPDPDVVCDERSFLAFVKLLAEDRRQADLVDEGPCGAPRRWQNHTIQSFLEGATSWAEDSDFGRSQDLDESTNPWHRFAVFLYCGKIYE